MKTGHKAAFFVLSYLREMNALKRILFVLCICLWTIYANAQPAPPGAPAVVITEIMYNPPESGAYSLEFIEVRNPNDTFERSLSGYFFSEGIDFTFPIGYLIAPHAYVIVAKDSVAFENAFGVEAFQWNNSSLLNTGEAIVIKQPSGQAVDSVNYQTSIPWPSAANGNGMSLTLCNDTLENAGPTNWTAATTSSGFSVDGILIYANPGAGCNGFIGIEERSQKELNIYPNPNNGQFRLNSESLKTGRYSLKVFRLNGQQVLQKQVQVLNSDLSVELNVPTGIYLVQLVGTSSIWQRKLIML